MDAQNVTEQKTVTTAINEVVTYDSLDAAKRALIDYRALSGLITDDNGMRKMSMEEFAGQLGVARKTLYDWQNTIPDFWVLVNQRRTIISPQSRLARIEETWYMKAVKGDWQHLNAWLLNYKPGYKTPTSKASEDAVETLADLFKKVDTERHVIEATVTTSDATEQQPNS